MSYTVARKGRWSAVEDAMLTVQYAVMPARVIAAMIERTESGVQQRAARLGVSGKKPMKSPWGDRNRDRRNRKRRERYHADPVTERARSSAWGKANREKVRSKANKRLQLKRAHINSVRRQYYATKYSDIQKLKVSAGRAALCDHYVLRIICERAKIPKAAVPKELIELVRANIQAKRLLKEMK